MQFCFSNPEIGVQKSKCRLRLQKTQLLCGICSRDYHYWVVGTWLYPTKITITIL